MVNRIRELVFDDDARYFIASDDEYKLQCCVDALGLGGLVRHNKHRYLGKIGWWLVSHVEQPQGNKIVSMEIYLGRNNELALASIRRYRREKKSFASE
jgi:hypothetical protein